MRILVVATENAFPARDGVTIPIAGFTEGWQLDHEVHYLKLNRYGKNDPHAQSTADHVSRYHEASIQKVPTYQGITKELMGKTPFYGAWKINADDLTSLRDIKFDLIFVATAPAIAIWTENQIGRIIHSDKLVAAISDLHSLVMHQQATHADKSESLRYRTLNRALMKLRTKRLAAAEKAVLSKYDLVIVQSGKELEWAKQIGGHDLVEGRFLVIPNGVCKDLFRLPLDRTQKNLVFVGALEGVYGQRLKWLIENFWLEASARHPTWKFRVVGRNPNSDLKVLMEKSNIEHQVFVQKLEDVYADSTILLAPIFKGYGLINKVVEAMAAGTVVVGDTTAFNGIPEFQDQVHGVCADTPEKFIDACEHIFSNEVFAQEVRGNARRLMWDNFSWDSRLKLLSTAIPSS